MRILYFHQYFATPDGSGGTRSYEFARRWVESGHSVTVVTSNAVLQHAVSSRTSCFIVDGVEILALDVDYRQSMSVWRRKLAFAEFAVRAAFAARNLSADIVLATSTPLTISIPGVASARRNKVPFILEIRDLWPAVPIAMGALRNPLSRLGARLLERWSYRSAQHIVALSPGMAAGIARSGVPETKISMIPNSSDIGLFSDADSLRLETRVALGIAPSDVLVLYAGSFGRVNRLDYVVQVAREVQTIDTNLQFLLVGSGSEFETVTDLAQQAGVLGKNLNIRSAVPKRELVGMFGAADIVTSVVAPIPELRDNSANKFFDGLAAGRAVAINHEGWQADILRETGAGIVLDEDPARAARQLADYSSNRAAFEVAGVKALGVARSRFSREVHARQLEAILREQHQSALSASREL